MQEFAEAPSQPDERASCQEMMMRAVQRTSIYVVRLLSHRKFYEIRITTTKMSVILIDLCKNVNVSSGMAHTHSCAEAQAACLEEIRKMRNCI